MVDTITVSGPVEFDFEDGELSGWELEASAEEAAVYVAAANEDEGIPDG